MKCYTVFAHNGNGVSTKANVTQGTLDKIDRKKKEGAEIIINQSWDFKGKGYTRIEKIVQTNSKVNQFPKHIVWACYK